ncbi:methionyl-tRNA formyltransferase [Teredinibacter sp. KSP-S5-2]|uniref:methionyl-tRNA formyltransferase n=1 Tax=Teredinibacter sp. KSP-S5-2 TaxID=3034506 RepID=UPI00293505C8|nr:methionyl-tRNA formyltransferase [Teredinibacter sp. KSP-S5-2]WNO09163.1 methionyl-tRNA formyltransferase [Teredinibacter sp. KSP-S5-2]
MSHTQPLNIVFAGTPDFAAKHLEALLQSPHNILAVYTQPDRPAGRGKKLTPSPVKQLAEEHSIPVFQPESLKTEEAQAELKQLNPDLMIVVAYGLLLPQAVLDTPKFGCFNVHGSLLPKWRGAAPIQRAVQYGDTKTGVTIMQMDIGLDTGDMLLKAECDISPTDTSGDLYQRLAELGPQALLTCLEQLSQGKVIGEKQSDEYENTEFQYARKIEKSEAEIDWSLPAPEIERKIRAFNPFPVCYTTLGGERLRIQRAALIADTTGKSDPGKVAIREGSIEVQCGSGSVRLLELQLPGKKSMEVEQFLNGFSSLLQQHSHLGQ